MGPPEQQPSDSSGLPGPEESALLYESLRTRVVRMGGRARAAGGPGSAGAPVIWKEPLGPSAARRRERELDVLARLAAVPGVPKVVQASGGGTGFALRDDGGVPLAEVLADPAREGRGVAGSRQLVTTLQLLADLAGVLADTHAVGIVHKDVNPANILVTAGDGRPVLIDWDLASTFGEERPDFAHEARVAGTLPYLAPEQTGRTGYPVDPRTDLYAFGATCFECLTGTPPFGRADALTLIHDHLARVPERVDLLNPVVPEPVAQIVARLLEKSPDRRYQSASGVRHDLLAVVEDLAAGRPPTLQPGRHDVPLRIAPPSRPVGREAELELLVAAFDRSFGPDRRIVLVGGPPGVGKTSLVDELRPVVAARNGWFVQGKFDQYRRDGGGDALAQALTGLAGLLLAEPESRLAQLREQAATVLGDDAGVLVAVIPALAPVLEVDPAPVAAGEPQQLTTQLLRAGTGLLRLVVGPDRPLVLFADDLQWAGTTPVAFLDAVVGGGGPPGFLLVGAVRDGATDQEGPLADQLERWAERGRDPVRIELTNLAEPQLRRLLAQTLRLDPDAAATADLTRIVAGHTGGNPLETLELVDALHRDGLLTPHETGWHWDEQALHRYLRHAGDRDGALAARVEALPAPSVAMLDALACLGGRQRLDTLAAACGVDVPTLERALEPCRADGFVIAVQDGCAPAVRFRHDRIREAVYTRHDADARALRHRELARRLLAAGRDDLAAENYLVAAPTLTDPRERVDVARLFSATAAAIRLVNEVSAERFLAAGVALLDGLDLDVRDLATALLIQRHQALVELARFEDADAVYATLVAREPDPVVLAPATGVRVVALNHRARPAEAVDLALRGLAAVGFPAPPDAELDAVNAAGLAALDAWLAAGPAPDELDRPECTDPRVLAAAVLIERVVPAAYYLNHPLMPWLMFLSHRLWTQEGPCPALVSCFGGVGMTGVNLRGDYGLGYAVNRRILAVGEARGWEPDTSQLRNTHTNFALPYFEPVESVVQEALTARERLLRCGELQYASFTYVSTLWAALDCYPTLDAVQTELTAAMTFWANTGYRAKVVQYTGYRQLLRCLRGETDRPGGFADAEFDDDAYLAELGQDRVSVLYYHLVRALAAAVFSDLERAGEHARAAMALADAAPGMYLWTTVRCLLALSCLQRARGLPPRGPDAGEERGRLVECAEKQLDWLTERARTAPVNYAHLVLWLQAELAWTQGRFDAAAAAFDRATTQVGIRRPWHAALITERAGRLHAEHRRTGLARLLLDRAADLYAGWGAAAKVESLERHFPGLAGSGRRPEPATRHTQGSHRVTVNGSLRPGTSREHTVDLTLRRTGLATPGDAIDLLAVLKASQALAGETNLSRLRRQVVDVLGAMAGATAVQLALWNDDTQGWFLPAGDDDADDRDRPMRQLALDDDAAATLVCRAAVRYAARTGEPLLVPDATADDRFRDDPYLAGLAQCSLLALPIVFRGRPRALVLLENRLAHGVFSSARLDAVRLVAGQLAVSLDNALAERFRSLVQRSGDLTLVCDRRARISYASQAAGTVLGTPGRELVGQTVPDLVAPQDRDRLLAWLDALDGAPALECRPFGPPGEQRWVEITGTDLTGDPAVAGLVLHLRDISERRRLEAELRQTHKMESIGQLAAGVAHEINNPVQFIADNLRFIADSLPALDELLTAYRQALDPQLTTEQLAAHRNRLATLRAELDEEYLRTELPEAAHQALEGTRKVTRIVRAMRAFSHPTDGLAAPADVNEAVRTALLMTATEVDHVADVVLELGDLPPVRCNVDDITQALINLVVNAAQAIGEAQASGRGRGTLTVRSRLSGDQVELQVADTGVGIPPEIADRVFDQFFTTKPVGVGTGQGLSLVYTLVRDRHHGTITFSSEPGVGTTFTVRLPVGDAPEPTVPRPREAPA